MAKMPAFQFYPGDWRKDVGVQSLDYFDRGVWHEMLCLMHESERRGVLVLNGNAMTDDMLARLLGLDKQILTTTLTTLLTSGVASREPGTGAVMCRRMVRDEKLREIRAAAGKLGGNPALLNQNTTTQVKPAANQTPTPSSSSSVSSSVSIAIAKAELPEGAKNAPSSSDADAPYACETIEPETPAGLFPANGFEDAAVTTSHPTGEDLPVGTPTREDPQMAKALQEVFAYYLTTMQRNPRTYSFSALRRKKGMARLEEALRMTRGSLAGAVELMKAVIDEVARSDFHMGRSAKTEGKSYCEWEDHIFRSTEQFEKWVQRYQEAARKEQHA